MTLGMWGLRTLHRLGANFYISGVQTVMRKFVWACIVCQWNKTEHLHPDMPLQPLELPSTN
jgi:hypothetical protein